MCTVYVQNNQFSVILGGFKQQKSTCKKRTTSEESTKDPFPKCLLFGGLTVYIYMVWNACNN